MRRSIVIGIAFIACMSSGFGWDTWQLSATPLGLMGEVALSSGEVGSPANEQTGEKGKEDTETNTSVVADEHPMPSGDPRDRIYYPGDTERLKPLMRKLGGNIILDQKEIWTSPFRMNRQNAKWWIGFGAATAALIATDHRTINAFENSSGQVTWGQGISRIGASYTLLPLVAGFYGYGIVRDNPKARETGILGAEALLDSIIVVQALKAIVGRNRPDAPTEEGKFFEGGASFPSGHAILSWSMASLLAHEYKDTKIVPIVAYGLAAVASSARFAAQEHYASDIVAGGAMGWFIGRYVYKTHEDHALHRHTWFKPQIVPIIQPGGNTFAIMLVLGN